MQDFGRWVDAHSHLADSRWGGPQEEVLKGAVKEAQASGIGFFLQGGVGPEDWARQKELSRVFPGLIGLAFGLHPYWVAEHSEEEGEDALDLLTNSLHEAMALGETGLDFRPPIMKDSRERQLHFFQAQLELAQVAEKPLVLHIVQAQDEALRMVDLFGSPSRRGFVHSFNSSWLKAQEWIQRGFLISVGGPAARPNNAKLHETLRHIPLECLLLETDSPDQPPPAFEGQKNPPGSLWIVANTIAQLRGMTPSEILDMTSANFRRLFGM